MGKGRGSSRIARDADRADRDAVRGLRTADGEQRRKKDMTHG
jgi:hypothetical protein